MSMHKKPLTELEHAGLKAHGLDIGTPSQLSDVFRQGIAFALANATTVQREGWVSVEDRLPEFINSDNHETEPMLESARVITFKDGIYEFDRVFKIGSGDAKFFINNPTHWMPLPNPPKLNEAK